EVREIGRFIRAGTPDPWLGHIQKVSRVWCRHEIRQQRAKFERAPVRAVHTHGCPEESCPFELAAGNEYSAGIARNIWLVTREETHSILDDRRHESAQV